MRYLLDANVIITLIRGKDPVLAGRLRKDEPSRYAISSIVTHELYFGAFKSARPSYNSAVIDGLQFPVLDFDQEDARHAAEIRASLALRGTPIGPFDVLIAGQARARKMVLITHNTREFARIPGLRIEDWHA